MNNVGFSSTHYSNILVYVYKYVIYMYQDSIFLNESLADVGLK